MEKKVEKALRIKEDTKLEEARGTIYLLQGPFQGWL